MTQGKKRKTMTIKEGRVSYQLITEKVDSRIDFETTAVLTGSGRGPSCCREGERVRRGAWRPTGPPPARRADATASPTASARTGSSSCRTRCRPPQTHLPTSAAPPPPTPTPLQIPPPTHSPPPLCPTAPGSTPCRSPPIPEISTHPQHTTIFMLRALLGVDYPHFDTFYDSKWQAE
ncbi:hypothetical protein J437_LFUL008169 [Ladona fulva]|uniref:Uncharacterized protein n=1 Tax=Ladona fulva TaxID=123851 RepID=A0A8K0KM27_LADFU|nr:hypothetical protein J437_LFUL008169 [Ladona fulva]